MLWKTVGCVLLFVGAVSLAMAGESEAPAKKRCPGGGEACAGNGVTGERTQTADDAVTSTSESGCKKCTKTQGAAEEECHGCDKTKVAAEKPCKGCDKTKVAAENLRHCNGKTKVAAERSCKGCDKAKVTTSTCKGCDKTKVVVEKEGKCCDATKVASMASECCKNCDCDVAVAEHPRCVCEAAVASVERACEQCADTFAVLERACRLGASLCATDAVDCTACSSGERCEESCTDRVASAVTFGEDQSVCTAGLVQRRSAQVQPHAPCAGVAGKTSDFADMQALLNQKIAERDELQHEIDELSAATQTWQQVLVRVKVLEVNLTKMRKLGIDFSQAEGIVTDLEPTYVKTTSAVETCSKCPETTAAYTENASPPCGTATCQKSGASFWDMLKDNNVARVIAEPTVVTVSGRPASFHVGGELPIPAGKDAPIACDFVRFGTQLDVVAVTLGDNRVRLEIRPRISEIRDDRSMVVDGHKIPSLNVTECDSACELAFGETAALSGLVQRRTVATKSDAGVREHIEDVMLMVVVTPEAVTSSNAERTAKRLSVAK